MRFVDLIEKKADGMPLSTQEIKKMIDGYVANEIPDYQMSAMAMAILQRGMNDRESADLAMAMMNSGDVADLSDLPGVKVDKHSTGGVGDTTTLAVAPLVAACGGTVAKMSGRGLGHTGGTLDKLEAIPGTRVEISLEEFKEIVLANGVSVIGQSGNLVPADKKLYALRDVTATVRSIPLIASSIMSKKLAAGTDAIVLDVKSGNGAFMRTDTEARELATLMVRIGKRLGKRVSAIVTDMSQPLGNAIGNALEVKEAVELLSGLIPESAPLRKVCLLLGSHMLCMSNIAKDVEEAHAMLEKAIKDGSGLARLQKMISLQSGDSSFLCMERIDELIHVKRTLDIPVQSDGYIYSIDARKIGIAAQMLGAGREKKGDPIDYSVGLVMKARRGDYMQAGAPICRMYVNDERNLEEARNLVCQAIQLKDERPQEVPIVHFAITDMDI